jgi:hypothetical protein
MRVQWKLGAAIAAAVLVVSTSANAQTRGATRSSARSQSRLIELGLDGTMAFGMGDVKTTQINLPFNQLRAGFYLNDQISIEPSVSLNYTKASAGGVSASSNSIDLGASMLWHLNTDRSQNQWYIRPGIDMLHLGASSTGGASDSENQFGLGAAFGLKMPLLSRMATRFEVGLQHRLETDNIPSQTFLGFSAGFSFFTR